MEKKEKIKIILFLGVIRRHAYSNVVKCYKSGCLILNQCRKKQAVNQTANHSLMDELATLKTCFSGQIVFIIMSRVIISFLQFAFSPNHHLLVYSFFHLFLHIMVQKLLLRYVHTFRLFNAIFGIQS